MGVYIPNMEMPKSCWGCELLSSCKAMPKNPSAEEIGIYTVMRLKDCPLIEIEEPTETLIHDIRKFIAFIEPRIIIASTYAEQIERAEEVKNWLLSIVGEFNADQHTQCVESVGENKKTKKEEPSQTLPTLGEAYW